MPPAPCGEFSGKGMYPAIDESALIRKIDIRVAPPPLSLLLSPFRKQLTRFVPGAIRRILDTRSQPSPFGKQLRVVHPVGVPGNLCLKRFRLHV